MVNKISVVGTVRSIRYDHINQGSCIFRIELSTIRQSGTEDILKVNIDKCLLDACTKEISVGDRIQIDGSIRTYVNCGHCILVVVAKKIQCINVPQQDYDVASVQGRVCKPVIFRRTPLGRHILEVTIATTSKYGKSSYIPCILWQKLAYNSSNLSVGDEICVTGRLQSRVYNKKLGETTVQKQTNEFSVQTIMRVKNETDTVED